MTKEQLEAIKRRWMAAGNKCSVCRCEAFGNCSCLEDALVAEVEKLRELLRVAFDIGETNLLCEGDSFRTMSGTWVDAARGALGEE